MRSIRARRGWLPGAALALAMCAGCKDPYPHPRRAGAGATSPHRGGTFRIAFDSDIRSLDPKIGYDEYSTSVLHLLFDRLVDYVPGTTQIGPMLAERWEVTEGGRVYTFHLRPGVRFHTGRVMVADDVRRSFERMLSPRPRPCPNPSFYYLIDGARDFLAGRTQHVRGITAPDDATVQFRLTDPDPTFLNVLAMPFAAPVPVEVAESRGFYGFAQNPVGTGPFMLETLEPATRVVLRRNPYYWRPGYPYLDRIVIDIGLARHLQFMRFQRGDLDHAHSLSMSTSDYVWLTEQAAWRPYFITAADLSMHGLVMNTQIPPWNNRHLRRAVAYAIDREAICRAKNYRIRPLGGVLPPGMPGYDAHLPNAQRFDLAFARREMALAGYAQGLPGEHDLWVGEGDAGAFYGQLYQADLARLGIRIRVRQVSFATYLEMTRRRGAVELYQAGWNQDFPDPSNFLETLFHSRNIQDEGSENGAFYVNHAFDALLDRARLEPDHAQRLALYHQAEMMVVDDAPWAFLFNPIKTECNQPYVRGYRPHPVYSHDFRDVWLDLPTRPFAGLLTPSPAFGLAALQIGGHS